MLKQKNDEVYSQILLRLIICVHASRICSFSFFSSHCYVFFSFPLSFLVFFLTLWHSFYRLSLLLVAQAEQDVSHSFYVLQIPITYTLSFLTLKDFFVFQIPFKCTYIMKEWRLSPELTLFLQMGGAQICGNPWNVILLWCKLLAFSCYGVEALCFANEVDPVPRIKIKGLRSWHATVNCQEDNCPELKADAFLQITSQVWHHRFDSLRLNCRLAPFCF